MRPQKLKMMRWEVQCVRSSINPQLLVHSNGRLTTPGVCNEARWPLRPSLTFVLFGKLTATSAVATSLQKREARTTDHRESIKLSYMILSLS